MNSEAVRRTTSCLSLDDFSTSSLGNLTGSPSSTGPAFG